jgi:hypothetical protein
VTVFLKGHSLSYAQAIVLLAAVMALPACGGSDRIVDPPPPPPPPAPVRTVLGSGSTALAVEEFVVVSFATTAAGALDATVDWTFASNLLLMYITQGDCTVEQFAEDVCPDDPACACRIAVRSENPFVKPRVLSLASAAAGPYTLIVWNLGPEDESISFQVGLTRSVAGGFDGPVRSSGSRAEGSAAAVRHVKRRLVDRAPQGR